MRILGISCFYHDSAVSLVENGKITFAAQEERFTRKKHDKSFPFRSILSCLEGKNLKINDIDFIVFYEKPSLKLDRIFKTYLDFTPNGLKSFNESFPTYIKNSLFKKRNITSELEKLGLTINEVNKKLFFSEHHLSHAASAFYPSPFDKSAVLTMDGVGEWTTTSIAFGEENKIQILKEISFPNSLGLLYSAFTYYTGFKVLSGEYKLMGLAPYGVPKYVDIIKDSLIEINNDGSFILNMDYFNYTTGLTMINKKFESLFGQNKRISESKLTQFHMDIAASIQKVTEEVVLKMCKHIKSLTSSKNLCLAGGVALNCVANGKIVKEKIFDNVWIQPAAGDAGGALGAALTFYYDKLGNCRPTSETDTMFGSFLGPIFTNQYIEEELKSLNSIFEFHSEENLYKEIANEISNGKAVGWFQDKMEFGPRSLGNRSILADPRSPIMQKNLNLKIKYRESFRPFAPSIIKENLNEWFDLDIESPYMLLVADVAKNHHIIKKNEDDLFGIEKLNIARSTVPAITHVDNSARIQTVCESTNKRYYKLIKEFFKITGCPILVNTSFNIRGEPIVCSPKDAFKCFMGTELDLLVIGNYVLRKEKQKISKKKYLNEFELD